MNKSSATNLLSPGRVCQSHTWTKRTCDWSVRSVEKTGSRVLASCHKAARTITVRTATRVVGRL